HAAPPPDLPTLSLHDALPISLWRSLQGPADAPFAVSRRAPRQARMFNTPTQIAISVDERNRRSVLELTAGDRPGLLCDVGKVLRSEEHTSELQSRGHLVCRLL